MKPEILLIGDATERMMNSFNQSFTLHKLNEQSNEAKFLEDNGDNIVGVATDGHFGVAPHIMGKLPNLKVISSYGVGYDSIDTSLALQRNIMVAHTPTVLNKDVANTAIMLMLATSRCLIRDDNWVRSGNWAAKGAAPLTRSIEGKRVGIIGLGRIGETIAHKLSVFDCEISYHNRNKKDGCSYTYYSGLHEMATNVDYLIICTPGGASTNNMVDAKIINALGAEGTLINVGRGSVVDETALIDALIGGRLGWAGLDVYANEPQVPIALTKMENVILTPHVASATVETRQAMGDLTVENLVRFFTKGSVSTPVPECAHMIST